MSVSYFKQYSWCKILEINKIEPNSSPSIKTIVGHDLLTTNWFEEWVSLDPLLSQLCSLLPAQLVYTEGTVSEMNKIQPDWLYSRAEKRAGLNCRSRPQKPAEIFIIFCSTEQKLFYYKIFFAWLFLDKI